MSPQRYNKLVRDRVPEIIQAEGRVCRTAILDDAEYRRALLAKLVEEAEEAGRASELELAGELADLYEVIDAIIAAFGLTKDQLLALQAHKRQARGGFAGKILLLDAD